MEVRGAHYPLTWGPNTTLLPGKNLQILKPAGSSTRASTAARAARQRGAAPRHTSNQLRNFIYYI